MTAPSNLHWARPLRGSATGVLVLAGSSGRLDVGRANMLAFHGVTALALRWFGGEGQRQLPCEIPVETFSDAIGLLAAECERIVVIGLSYGAEAALLTSTVDSRVDALIAVAPTDVVWEGQHEHDDDPRRSKWTRAGDPVPFVPLDRDWRPVEAVPAYVEHYERSRELAGPSLVEAATIPVEDFDGDLVLVAGGDDKAWPSARASRAIAERRARFGLVTAVIEDEAAGHQVVLPGENPPDARRPYQVGGDAASAQRLGRLAWPAVRRVLRLPEG